MTHSARGPAIWVAAGLMFLASATYLAVTFQWREAFALLAHAHVLLFVLGSGGALIVYWILRAWRWQMLMQAMGVRSGFLALYLCSSVALSLSVLTPLQSGEVLKIELLRKYGNADRLPGYSAFAIERVADLYSIVALGLGAVAAAMLAPAAAVLVVLLLFAMPVAMYPLLHRPVVHGRIGLALEHARSGVSSLSALLALMATTFASWLVVAAAWHACLRSVSIGLDLGELIGLLSLVTLATILSFVPAGLGVAEASVAAILSRYGVEPALAQAGALALRAFSLLVVALGALHLVWLRIHWKGR